MDENLKSRLNEGETILWQSKTEPIQALDKTNQKRFFTNLIVCSMIAIVLIVLYLTNVKGEVKFSAIVIVLVLCAFAPLRRILDASAVKKLQYLVTDQRLLVFNGSEIKGVELGRIQDAVLKLDADGHLSLLVGSRGIKTKPDHWRELAIVGQPSSLPEEEPIETFGFYAVDDRAGLKKVLAQVLPLVKS